MNDPKCPKCDKPISAFRLAFIPPDGGRSAGIWGPLPAGQAFVCPHCDAILSVTPIPPEKKR